MYHMLCNAVGIIGVVVSEICYFFMLMQYSFLVKPFADLSVN